MKRGGSLKLAGVWSVLFAAAVAPGLVAADGPPPPLPNPVLLRYELGRRLRTFETRWEGADAAGRKRAAETLTGVHPQLLTLRFVPAARTFDQAAHRFDHADLPGPAREWVNSLSVVPELRFVDGRATELNVSLRTVYPVGGEVPKGLEVQLWFTDKHVVTVKPTRFPHAVAVPLPPLGDARGLDRKLYFAVEAGRERRLGAVGVSQAEKLADRVAAVRTAAGAWAALDTIERATVRDRGEQLARLAAGGVEEIDVPAAGLLANAEAMLAGQPFFTAARSGQFWLSVPLGGKKTIPARVFVPKGLDAKTPVPVVVGLHGAGGSENIYFEGYGAGYAVAECARRGWVFVATRSGLDFVGGPPVPAVLDVLATRYPLDLKRVFLVGHSMGATQTVALAQKYPGRFAAVAALGGGGLVNDPKPFATLPVFIGAGAADFGRGYARDLNADLAAGGATAVTFKEYPGIEHLLIVRAALPDVFAGFDKVAGK